MAAMALASPGVESGEALETAPTTFLPCAVVANGSSVRVYHRGREHKHEGRGRGVVRDREDCLALVECVVLRHRPIVQPHIDARARAHARD
eukprot:1683777-Prymnesium_polylepis.6